jgi:hypothetical protein
MVCGGSNNSSGFGGLIPDGGWEFFSSPLLPDQLWGPPSLLYNGYRGSFSGRETDHSHPSSVKVKNAWRYASTPQYVFMVWCLVKHREKFTFTFYLYLKWLRELHRSDSLNVYSFSSYHCTLRRRSTNSCTAIDADRKVFSAIIHQSYGRFCDWLLLLFRFTRRMSDRHSTTAFHRRCSFLVPVKGVRKFRRMTWAVHVKCIREKRNAYRILFGNPAGKRLLGRPTRWWQSNIKINLKGIECDSMESF